MRLYQICGLALPTLSNDKSQFFPEKEIRISRYRKNVAPAEHASYSKPANHLLAGIPSSQQNARVQFSAGRDAAPSFANPPDAAVDFAQSVPAEVRNRNPLASDSCRPNLTQTFAPLREQTGELSVAALCERRKPRSLGVIDCRYRLHQRI